MFYYLNFIRTILAYLKNNRGFLFLFLALITIPFHHLINSFFIFIFILQTVFAKKRKKKEKYTFLLMLFYALMAVSFFWSTEKTATINALSTGLPLLIIPLSFLISAIDYEKYKSKTLEYYSYSIVFLSAFFILKAFNNYILNRNINVFFFHNLVSKELNAVHFSVFVSLAFFYFLTKDTKSIKDFLYSFFLYGFLLLLSSKIIIFTTCVLIVIYFFFYSKSANKMRLKNIIILGMIIASFLFLNVVKERIVFEFKIKSDSNIGHTVINKKEVGTNIISMKEAWFNEKFNQTDYFSGSSFRVYQARLFFEFLKEENIFWTGFGLNASYKKIEKKGIQYNVFQGNETTEGYQKKNFHNQYIQVFAELGVFGFLLLSIMLLYNLKNGIKKKDFIHIAFAILMISLFLTESFLWRQRGVIFFTIFYCLFNSKTSTIKAIQKR